MPGPHALHVLRITACGVGTTIGVILRPAVGGENLVVVTWRLVGLLTPNNAEESAMDGQPCRGVVVDETKFSELVHEVVDARAVATIASLPS